MDFLKTKLGKLIWRGRGGDRRNRSLGHGRGVALVILVVCLVGIVLYLAFWPRNRIYTLDINTEVVSFIVENPALSEWNVGSGELYTNFSDEKPVPDKLDNFSILILNKGVNVEVQRHGVGLLFIRLRCEGGKSVGKVEQLDGKERPLNEWALIKLLLKDKPIVLPFRGYLSVGEDITTHVDSMLLGGTVSIIEEKLFTKEHYSAGQENLVSGDRVQLWVKNGSVGTPASEIIERCGGNKAFLENQKGEGVASRLDGFIRAEPKDGFSEAKNSLSLIAHGNAEYATVERFGSGGYEVSAQPWMRFINDPILGVLVAFLGILVLSVEVTFKAAELREKLVDTSEQKTQQSGRPREKSSHED